MFELKRMAATLELPSSLIKPSMGKPLIWIKREDSDVFLNNATDEVLSLVQATSGGFFTSDDGVHALESDAIVRYEDVRPGEAVKVDEYDNYYDLDYVLQIQIQIESLSLGKRELLTLPEKGGANTQVLLRGEVPAAII